MIRLLFIAPLVFSCLVFPRALSADDDQWEQNVRHLFNQMDLQLEKIVPLKLAPGALSSGRYLMLKIDRARLTIPRQFGVVEEVFGINSDGRRAFVALTQNPTEWFLARSDPKTVMAVLRFRESFQALSAAPRIAVRLDQVNKLPAKYATVSGEKLQFEPLAYKNTVGYWVDTKAAPAWRLNVVDAGTYRVRILQGCGRGQGGSEVELRLGDVALPYKVQETGQFQTFRWFDVGVVKLPAGERSLKVHVQKLAKSAVMDIRQIRLESLGKNNESASGGQSRPAKKRPNLVVFYTDDQGTLDMNCYGSRDLHTPNMDGLAYSGTRFTQAYAHTVCCPSRAMLLTGRHPQRSNVNNWTQGNFKGPVGRNMNLDEITIAELLKPAGYSTALFGKWHLGAAATHGPTCQGFDQFFGLRGGFIDNFNHHFLHQKGFHDLYNGTTEVFRPGEYLPDLVTEKAIHFVEQNQARPFFLYLPFNIPHYPEQADPVFEQRYHRLKEPRRSYAKIISTTDERIGRVLRKLDELRIRENTIVILMSDNGHSAENYQIRFADHASGLPKGHDYGANGGGGNTGKWRGNKSTFFEGGLRVPAIISFEQELPTNQVRDQIITACDWFPTVAELVGLELPDRQLDGESLLPIIREEAESHHDVLHWQWQSRWAVRRGAWKLIRERNRSQLFRLDVPKPESEDLAEANPDRVKELVRLHNDWIQQLQQSD